MGQSLEQVAAELIARAERESRPRARRLEIALHDHELAQIATLARQAGHRPGSWARHVLLQASPPSPRRVSTEAQALWTNLAAPLGLLAQIVRHLNYSASVDPVKGDDALRERLGELREVVDRIQRDIRTIRVDLIPTK